MNTYHISADIFKVLGILNVSLKSPQNRIFVKSDIVVKDNVVAITLEDNSECIKQIECKLIFEEINIIDQSLQISKINADQLSFHLQLDLEHKNMTGLKKSSSEQNDASDQLETRRLILSEKFSCSCAACSHELFSSDQFDEVLPVGSFSEIAELSWCLCRCGGGGGAKKHRIEDFSSKYDKHMNRGGSCGDHNHSTPVMNSGKNVIFLSDTSLMFEADDVNIKSMRTNSGSIFCSECKTMLGSSSSKLVDGYKRKTDSHLLKLLIHSLSFTFHQSSFQMWPSSPDDLQVKVSDVLTSGNIVGSRFVVEVRTEGNKLRPLVLMTLLSLEDVIYTHDCDALEGEHLLKPINTIKVLAKHCTTEEDTKLGKDWLKDFSVEDIEIPERLGHLLVDTIKRNDLLSGEKASNGFGVSYLRKRKF